MRRAVVLSCLLQGGCIEPAPIGTAATWVDASTTPRKDPPTPGTLSHLSLVVPRFEVELTANTPGHVAELPFGLGDRVAAGAPIAMLVDPDLDHAIRIARAEVEAGGARAAETRSTHEFAGEHADRIEALREHASADERKRTRYEARLAETRATSARRALDIDRARVERLRAQAGALVLRAPFEAELAARYVDPGQRVLADQPVVRLVSTQRVLRTAVPAESAAGYGVGAAIVHVDALSGIATTARVVAVAPEVDAAGLVLIEAWFDDRQPHPRAGSIGRVHSAPIEFLDE